MPATITAVAIRCSRRKTYYQSPALSDTFDQHIAQWQNTLTLAGNATYTEPAGKHGLLKAQYDLSHAPASAVKDAYNYDPVTATYSLADTVLSSTFYSYNTAHKAGISYQYHAQAVELSAGLNYQLTVLSNRQVYPAADVLRRTYRNVLPIATLQYKISKTKNLQLNYNTGTQPPGVSQLQHVVNNNDPLHLYTGNPQLRQPYSHTLSLRYNASNTVAKSSLSAALNAMVIQHSITTATLVAQQDTAIGGVTLPGGSQLAMPQNVDGYRNLSANLSYSLPLQAIKCRINISATGSLGHVPTIINNIINYQRNKNGGLNFSLSSNISEHTDFLVSSSTSVTASANSAAGQPAATYVNESSRATLNLILWQGIVVSTALSYQVNYGLAAGYNQSYLLWNMAIGKKLFKKKQGDIRLSVFDLLNQNSNIQHTITDTYIQDMRSNILQRYLMLVFTYKINKFN